MNYKIIFFLLFVLINSKKVLHPLFGKTMTMNLLSKSISSDSLEEANYCDEAGTKNQCLSIINPQRDYQCCYVKSKNDFGNFEYCSEYPKDMETFQKITKSSQYKAILKEVYGYASTGTSIEQKSKTNVNCNNGELTINFGYDTYTENEQNIFKNENYCLNKNSLKRNNYNYDVGKCEEGLLLESSKSAGLECG